MRLLSLLLLIAAPAHADTLTFDGDVRYEWDGSNLSRDGTDLGTMPWVQGSMGMAFRDRDLYVIHGDDCVLLLEVIPQPASDLDASGSVDDRDLNLLLSGEFILDDIDRMLRAFGFRFHTGPEEWLVLDGYYREPDGYPRPFCDPVSAEFVNDRLLVVDSVGNVVDVDVLTGAVSYVGGQTQPIPEPAAWLLLAVGILVLIRRHGT